MKKQEGTARERAHEILDMALDICGKTGKYVDFNFFNGGNRPAFCVLVKETWGCEKEMVAVAGAENETECRELMERLAAVMEKAPDVGASGAGQKDIKI